MSAMDNKFSEGLIDCSRVDVKPTIGTVATGPTEKIPALLSP